MHIISLLFIYALTYRVNGPVIGTLRNFWFIKNKKIKIQLFLKKYLITLPCMFYNWVIVENINQTSQETEFFFFAVFHRGS